MRISYAMRRKRQMKRPSRMCGTLNQPLTEAIQILSDFYTKVIRGDFARLESEATEAEFEAGSTFDEFTGRRWKVLGTVWRPSPTILISAITSIGVICEYLESSITGHSRANLPNSGAGGHEYHAEGLRGYPSSSGWKGTTVVCPPCER